MIIRENNRVRATFVKSSVIISSTCPLLIAPCWQCNVSLRLTFKPLCAGVKGPLTMGSQRTGSGARRRVNAPTARRSSPSPRCPMTAPPQPPWPFCRTSPVWSTPPSTPAWRTPTVSRAAQPAWPPAAAARRVSVSGRTDVCVRVWSCSVLHDVTLMLPVQRQGAGGSACQNDRLKINTA